MTLVLNMPEAEYFAHPALSQSQAKVLLTSPAKYRWQLDNPREDTQAFDVGHAAHAKILGVGAPVWVIEADSWRSPKHTAEAKAARTYGFTPLLRKDADAVDAMTEAVLAHQTARLILEREGDAEVSAFWTDIADSGARVQSRARFDKLTTDRNEQPVIVDLKTTARSAAPDAFAKAVVDFGYDLQAAWYTRGLETISGQTPNYLLICVEKDPPHLVAVHALDEYFMERGECLRRSAIDTYAACLAADEWPGHGDNINELTPPRWALAGREF